MLRPILATVTLNQRREHPVRWPTDIRTADSTSAEQRPDCTSGSLMQHRPNNRPMQPTTEPHIPTADSVSANQPSNRAMSTNQHQNCRPVRQHWPNSRRRDQQADQLNGCTPRPTSGQLPPDPKSANVPRLTSGQSPTPTIAHRTAKLTPAQVI